MTPQCSFSVSETRVEMVRNKKNIYRDSRGASDSAKNSAVPPGGEGSSSVEAIFPFKTFNLV
jgi:hypothetical protein